MENVTITIMGPNVDPDSLVSYFLENGPLPKGARIINKEELLKLNSSDNEFVECIHQSYRPEKPKSKLSVLLNKIFHGSRKN